MSLPAVLLICHVTNQLLTEMLPQSMPDVGRQQLNSHLLLEILFIR